MSSTTSPPFDHPSRPHSPRNQDDVRQLVSSAFSVIEQTPPPSLREILTAYRNKGDGDRDMLLAMLSAKTAEDQRIASIASLQRTLLDAYQSQKQESSHHAAQHHPHLDNSHHYPTPSFTQSPHPCDTKSRRQQSHYHHMPIASGSPPPRSHHHGGHHSLRDAPIYQEHPRKRRRASSQHRYERRPLSQHSSQHEHLPPSPYSSSGRSDSAEYSPRSRASMAIGSLLSSGPRPEANTEDP